MMILCWGKEIETMVRMALMIRPALPMIRPLTSSGAVISRRLISFSSRAATETLEASSKMFCRRNSRICWGDMGIIFNF